MAAKRSQTNTVGPTLHLPNGKNEEIAYSNLLLDPGNLRLFEESEDLADTPAKLVGEPSIQRKIYSAILESGRFDIKGLVTSISTNGFLRHERLIVARYNESKFLVLEGNRRLTAVERIYEHGINALPNEVVRTIVTLPCFVLDGDPIDGRKDRLGEYRRASEIYIGMRHLMGAKSWDPASRYEFQARLLDEGWTIDDVAKRFSRKRSEVLRDVKAQKLYRDFRELEKKSHSEHSLTYNAFAEVARAGALMKWLEWSDEDMSVGNSRRKLSLFTYLIKSIRDGKGGVDPDSDDDSAEFAVRTLNEMIKLGDAELTSAIEERDFVGAIALYEERKAGDFTKRLQSFITTLKRTTVSDLEKGKTKNKQLLNALIGSAQQLLTMISSMDR